MTCQQLLWVSTETDNIRSDAVGWGAEDGTIARHLRHDEHVGRSLAWDSRREGSYSYPTVVHAMGSGWHVMAPPENEPDGSWTWWLSREVEIP